MRPAGEDLARGYLLYRLCTSSNCVAVNELAGLRAVSVGLKITGRLLLNSGPTGCSSVRFQHLPGRDG